MAITLEHANISVQNINEAIRFLTTAFPEFTIRGRGVVDGNEWVHVGTDDTYIALKEATEQPAAGQPLNHLGFAVDNVEALAERMRNAGFQEGFIAPAHPYRIRKYFHDADGNEWEFVEYSSNDPAKRNDYSQ